MFTGIILAVGKVARLEPRGGDLRICDRRHCACIAHRCEPLAIGESIAVNGACLTVVAFANGVFEADVSQETLRVTTLGNLAWARR